MNAGSSFPRKLMGLLFAVAGVLHFLAPGAYARIMPPYLPLHRELVYLSGAAGILGGLGLPPKRTRRRYRPRTVADRGVAGERADADRCPGLAGTAVVVGAAGRARRAGLAYLPTAPGGVRETRV